MGMAASQARLLSITARLSDNEQNGQALSYAKERLADIESELGELKKQEEELKAKWEEEKKKLEAVKNAKNNLEKCKLELNDAGVRTFIEVGAGTTLSGLCKKMGYDDITVLNVADVETLESTVSAL